MRGQRTSISRKKADLILVAVRYGPDENRLELVKGFVRRGKVWGDIELFDRPALIQRIQAGERLFTGRAVELQGDFEIAARVGLRGTDPAGPCLVANGSQSGADDLALPLF